VDETNSIALLKHQNTYLIVDGGGTHRGYGNFRLEKEEETEI